jgi:IS5 family transposase
MTRWRQRLGTAGAELMLKETIATALKTGAATPAQMTRVNVDTTVQTKNVRFPTDTRLYDRARERLVKTARAAGLHIKQSYGRTGPRLLKQLSRLSRSHKTRQARACARKLHTNLGRVIREIERQKFDPESKLAKLLAVAKRIHTQQKHDKNKIYSVHEPEVQCIAKGKAGKKYEIGNKAGVVTTSQGCWLIGAMDFRDNPYDGHTLNDQMEQVERIVSNLVKEAHTDMSYRKHNYEGPVQIHVDQRHRGTIAKALWKRMKRRAAIEPTIGHLKAEHHLERNRLKGALGDSLNVLLGACGMNLRKLLRFFFALFLQFHLEHCLRKPTSTQALHAA